MPSSDSNRPNVIVILTDDQGAWAMGCAGNPEIRTPNLDRIAATGVRFSNFFCVSPVCSPARASLLTGRIPSQHGVHDWIRAGNSTTEPEREGALIEYLAGQPAYTDFLAQAGYTCGISGKWHVGDSHHPQKGFSFWEVHARGGSSYYNAPMIHDGEVYEEPRYISDAITDTALGFLDAQRGQEAPFYLSLHFTAPHSPWGRDEHPHDIYDEYHANCAFDSIPFEPMHPWQINSAPGGWDEHSRRSVLSGYFAAVTAMDLNVGRVLDWLEREGLREKTLIFFTSDNGMNMGHHGLYGKGNASMPLNLFDTSVKVPALISHPGRVPQGIVCDHLLSHYDFMPTLLEYVGLENPDAAALPGRSFAPLLRGECFEGDERVVVYDEYGPARMVRTREWKYIHRYPYGPHELYHLAEDPDERTNLLHDDSCAAVLAELRASLEAWFVQYADPKRDGARQAVVGTGQIGLVGPGNGGQEAFFDGWKYLSEDGEKPRRDFPVFS
ncbi:MAG: sulfatase-like hydrolase/transferase [Armatimonadetes bacterium]|nr:sulfatase-like hydrolase/transferase [Armatimonadota bacterium]